MGRAHLSTGLQSPGVFHEVPLGELLLGPEQRQFPEPRPRTHLEHQSTGGQLLGRGGAFASRPGLQELRQIAQDDRLRSKRGSPRSSQVGLHLPRLFEQDPGQGGEVFGPGRDEGSEDLGLDEDGLGTEEEDSGARLSRDFAPRSGHQEGLEEGQLLEGEVEEERDWVCISQRHCWVLGTESTPDFFFHHQSKLGFASGEDGHFRAQRQVPETGCDEQREFCGWRNFCGECAEEANSDQAQDGSSFEEDAG